jgi:hypothetical protein
MNMLLLQKIQFAIAPRKLSQAGVGAFPSGRIHSACGANE